MIKKTLSILIVYSLLIRCSTRCFAGQQNTTQKDQLQAEEKQADQTVVRAPVITGMTMTGL